MAMSPAPEAGYGVRVPARVHVVVLRGGQALPCLMVGGHGLERGWAHAGAGRLGERQLVIPVL